MSIKNRNQKSSKKSSEELDILPESNNESGQQQASQSQGQSQNQQQSQPSQSRKGETVRTASSFNPKIEQGHEAVEPDDSPVPEAGRDQEDEQDKSSDVTVDTLLRMVLGVVSGLAVNFTKVPDIAFTDNEKEVLVEAWKPFMANTIPPIWAAAMVTVTIVGGKVIIYMNAKKGLA